jgi:anti-sigma B factor antagonist
MGGLNGNGQLEAEDDLLHVHAEHDRGCVVIHVHGEIDFSTASLLQDEAARALEVPGKPRLVLDLAGVTFCDSSGLRVLAGIWKSVRAMDGRLALARVPERCRLLLKRTGLAQILQVHDRLAKAVAAVSS